jgi:hypothetical protein
MKPFKFFQKKQLNLPTQDRFTELVNHQPQVENTPEFEVMEHPNRGGRHPQIYTQMLRMNIPLNEMDSTQLDHLRMGQERKLMESITETLDFRHSIVYQDEHGFTIRTELYI